VKVELTKSQVDRLLKVVESADTQIAKLTDKANKAVLPQFRTYLIEQRQELTEIWKALKEANL
jgi:hypothetical protein